MIKAIIFDCFGVMTVDKWKEFVATLPEDQKDPARFINHAYDSGHINEAEFIEQVKALTGRDPGEVERILGTEDEYKNHELLEYIANLKVNYKIGILSNVASNWVRDTLLTPAEQGLFDTMIFSYEVGMTKPDERIFQLAAEKLGVSPAEAVLVDDNEPYCAVAREAGMQAICYRDLSQMKKSLETILKSN